MKNLFLFVISVLLYGLCSCSSDGHQNVSDEQKLEETILKARTYSKKLFSFHSLTRGNTESGIIDGIESEQLSQAESVLSTNIEIALENDIFFLLEQNNLNENLGFAMLDYYENMNFIDIAKKYNLSDYEIQFLANAAECIDFIKENKNSETRANNVGKAVMCTLAVVGSVGTTISAATIATPAGLAGWLFFKAVSLASIAGCAM